MALEGDWQFHYVQAEFIISFQSDTKRQNDTQNIRLAVLLIYGQYTYVQTIHAWILLSKPRKHT